MTPRPRNVVLCPHDPGLATEAALWAERLSSACSGIIREIHHIGSTSVPGMPGKPIIDLLAEVTSIRDLESAQDAVTALGFVWRGENGLPGRRYCTLSHPATGARRVHLHCYAGGDPAVRRHLALRDMLRSDPAMAIEYAREKARCAALHAHDNHAYTACKADWIRTMEARALSRR